jgi:xanthine/CO dehydrogenase XdhC/CoxF family maturation factor
VLNIADTLHTWCRKARPFALATVVQISGSAPLPVGTALAVDAVGNAVGSISGGCVEGAVYELCQQVLASDEPPTRARFGYSDDDAFAVGLTCGGELDVVRAENHVRAAQAACWYSWITPPRRSCRRMSRRAISLGSVMVSGSARSGAAACRERWVRCSL